MRFLAQDSISPSITPLFFLSEIVPKICLSNNFVIVALLTHQSYYTSCFLFYDSFSYCSLTNSDLFLCRHFLVPSNFDLKRNEPLLPKPGETQKSLKVQITVEWLRSCLFNHSEYSCPFWSTRDNYEFRRLQFSRILSDKHVIRYDEHHAKRAFKNTRKQIIRISPIIIKQ